MLFYDTNYRMNYRFILLLSALLPASVFAQNIITKQTAKGKALEYYTMGDNDIAYQKFVAADSFLHLAVQQKENFIDAWILIGQLNSQGMKNYPEAIRAYEKVKALQADYLKEVDYNLGLCYMNIGEYAKAKNNLSAYLALPKLPAPSRMLAEKMLTDCDFAEKAMKNPPSKLEVFTFDKKYEEVRESQIFALIESGGTISDGKFFKILCLLLPQ